MTVEQERIVLETLPLLDRLVRGFLFRKPAHVDGDAIRGAAHEALVKAALAFDASMGVPFAAWANKRLTGAMVDELRKITYGPRGAPLAVFEIRPWDAATQADRVDELLDLRSALAALSPENRKIVLATFGGYRLTELSDDLGITDSSISQRKHRSFKRLREALAA